MMIEKAIDVATQWAAFEPNDVLTRAKLHLVVDEFFAFALGARSVDGRHGRRGFFR